MAKAKKLQNIKNKNKKRTHILVPTDVTITSTDPNEILGNPNVTTNLPHQVKTEVKTEDDFIDIDPNEVQVVWDNNAADLVPLELDTDKNVMTGDGDVILTEPDNMQVQEGQLVPLSNNTLILPREENMTDVISTRNIVIKRKQPDISIGEIKKIKANTDISVKHPIFRKMEKNKKMDEKLAKILKGKAIEINIKDELLEIEDAPTLPALMPPPSGPLATVDAETMQRIPWVDFDLVLQNKDKHEREQAIFDILQANMPNIGDDIYYVYQDPETNVFSIQKDELAEEIQDFVETIRVVDAKLAVETLYPKERTYLLRKRALKIKELRKTYKANTLADVLDNKLSEIEKQILEDQAVELLKELNKDEDRYYFEFNHDTQEFEILLDSEVSINAIVFAVMQIDKAIKNVNTPPNKRSKLKKEKGNLLKYLDSKGATLLAASLRKKMYEIIFIIKNIIYLLIIILFIVNNGHILTGGDHKNERERVQREL